MFGDVKTLLYICRIKIKNMKKILRFFAVCFYYRFIVIEDCDNAIKRDLLFDCNVYGDGINRYNCRSFWYDKYGFRYRCAGLYKLD